MNAIIKLVAVPSIELRRLWTWDQRRKNNSKKIVRKVKRPDYNADQFKLQKSIYQKFL